MPSRQHGFTLIEMLVVIAILGVVIGVVVSHGPLRSTGLEARAAAGVLAQTFRTAHATAMAKATTVTVAIDPPMRVFTADNGPVNRFAPNVTVEVLREILGDDHLIQRAGAAIGLQRQHPAVEWLTGQVRVTDAP